MPAIPPLVQLAVGALLALVALPIAAVRAQVAPVDLLAHPVWGPALRAEAASAAADAPARAAGAAATDRALVGLSGWAQLRPSATWTHRDPSGRVAIDVSAGVAWRHDAAAIASARLDQHRGDVAAHERALRSVRDVTSAYVALRRAQVAVELAAAALPTRRLALERADAGLTAGTLGRTQRDVVALDLERAEEAVERASRDLAAAQRAAERLGIDVEAAHAQHLRLLDPEPFEGWRAVVPPLDAPHETLTRRALERDLAAARLERRGAWGVLDDLSLNASRSADGTRLRAGVGLDAGRPNAFADVAWTGTTTTAWSLGVSARLRVDDGTWSEFERAERALADADAALQDALAEAAWLAREAHRAVADAERDVAFAERALALGRAALRELGGELAAARAEARRTDGDERVAASARVERLEDAYRRAEIGHLRERDAFLRAWERYLREAERLWAGVGWPFGVVEGGSVGE